MVFIFILFFSKKQFLQFKKKKNKQLSQVLAEYCSILFMRMFFRAMCLGGFQEAIEYFLLIFYHDWNTVRELIWKGFKWKSCGGQTSLFFLHVGEVVFTPTRIKSKCQKVIMAPLGQQLKALIGYLEPTFFISITACKAIV